MAADRAFMARSAVGIFYSGASSCSPCAVASRRAFANLLNTNGKTCRRQRLARLMHGIKKISDPARLIHFSDKE
jgi:hypothetical protein